MLFRAALLATSHVAFVLLLAGPSAVLADGQSLTLEQALRSTLERSPAVRIQAQRVLEQAGNVRSQGTPFDTLLRASGGHQHDEFIGLVPGTNDAVFPDDPKTLSDTTTLGLSSLTGFRWGMTFEPSVTLARSGIRPGDLSALDPDTLMPGPVRAQRVLNTATVGFTITQQLLRGLGSRNTAAQERASRQLLEALEQDARFVGTSEALFTVSAYWSWVAASGRVSLLEQAVARAEQLLADTQTLVDAQERPAADLRQLRGNLASQNRDLIDARALRFQGKRELGLAMGLDAKEIGELADPSLAFPEEPVPVGPPRPGDALAQRADVLAAERRLEAAQTLRAAADWNRKPSLELVFGAGYTGATGESGTGPYFSSLATNVAGPTASAFLNLELPVKNAARAGAHEVQAAATRQSEIALWNVQRGVRTGTEIAHNTLARAAEALAEAKLAVDSFAQAVEDEREKLRAGLATVVDVVITQQQLVGAQQQQIFSQQRYMQALAQFAFAHGTLPSEASEVSAGGVAILTGTP